MDDCVFCHPDEDRVFLGNGLAYAMWDGFPVTRGHALVIPRWHLKDYFDLSADDLLACDALLRGARSLLLSEDPSIEAFNIGANVGLAAGQTIFHCHIHLIPRRSGDVENPHGGVRHLIPGKGAY